ncbi:hypothetical protein ACWF0M_20190 [Kribbella sp. NPDC055110]
MIDLPDWFVALMFAAVAWSTLLSTAIITACMFLDIFWCAAVLDWGLLWLLTWFLLPHAQRDRIRRPAPAQQYAGWPR